MVRQRVVVLGQGYVGLPLSIAAVRAGWSEAHSATGDGIRRESLPVSAHQEW